MRPTLTRPQQPEEPEREELYRRFRIWAFSPLRWTRMDRIIILVLDNAGWHTRPGLTVPEGIRLVYLPPYSPELQPAECLWPVLDEPLANKHFATIQDLDGVVAERCTTFVAAPDLYKGKVDFHWWPKPIKPA